MPAKRCDVNGDSRGPFVYEWRVAHRATRRTLAVRRGVLEEVADGRWGVYFCGKLLGIVDERRRKVVDAGQAVRKGTISESALRSPFRYAPGAPEGPGNV